MKMLMEIPYQLPGAQDIAPEEAFALAVAAARSTGWTDEWLGWCHYSISYRAYEGESPVYRVCWKLLPENRALFYKREMPFGVVVYLNPANGETLQCVTLDELDDFDRWCEFPDMHDTVRRPGVG